jgi:hypothetical protein
MSIVEWIGLAVILYLVAWALMFGILRGSGESWGYSIGMGAVWPLYIALLIAEDL